MFMVPIIATGVIHCNQAPVRPDHSQPSSISLEQNIRRQDFVRGSKCQQAAVEQHHAVKIFPRLVEIVRRNHHGHILFLEFSQ